MFQRFTESARRVVVLAQEEARRRGDNRIGTEHPTLGLLRQPGAATDVLEVLRVSPEAVRRRIDDAVPPGNRPSDSGGEDRHIPFTPRMKRSLELAPTSRSTASITSTPGWSG